MDPEQEFKLLRKVSATENTIYDINQSVGSLNVGSAHIDRK